MCDIYFGVKACRWSNMICLSLDCVIFETKVMFLCTMYNVLIHKVMYNVHTTCVHSVHTTWSVFISTNQTTQSSFQRDKRFFKYWQQKVGFIFRPVEDQFIHIYLSCLSLLFMFTWTLTSSCQLPLCTSLYTLYANIYSDIQCSLS